MGCPVYLYTYIGYLSYLNSVSQSAATVWNLEIRGFSVAHSRACLVLEKNMLDHGPRNVGLQRSRSTGNMMEHLLLTSNRQTVSMKQNIGTISEVSGRCSIEQDAPYPNITISYQS